LCREQIRNIGFPESPLLTVQLDPSSSNAAQAHPSSAAASASAATIDLCREPLGQKPQQDTKHLGSPSSSTQRTGKIKSSLQNRQGCVLWPLNLILFTPRERNSFVLARTVLFRKAQAGFEDTAC